MTTTRHNRLKFAQNFLKNPSYVRYLIGLSSVSANDHVLEIGAGSGIITAELAPVARRVTALEVDKALFAQVQEKLTPFENVTIKPLDILRYRLPNKAYKVFANIPFNITAEIVDKLLGSDFAPTHAYLIVQQEAAEKFVYAAEASALWQPFYDFEILTKIGRNRFQPMPSVDAALLGIVKRTEPHVAHADIKTYQRFVSFAYRAWKKDLKTAYRAIFTYNQWKRLAKDGRFDVNAKPTDLNAAQWVQLFRYFQVGVSAEKKMVLDRPKR